MSKRPQVRVALVAAPQRGRGPRALPLATLAVALGLAGVLKLHYQRADFEALRWVLEPTTSIVQVVSGSTFELEPRHGYLCRERRFEIVPACAGVNFMVVAFLSLVLGTAWRGGSAPVQGRLLVASMLVAYSVTIVANATRIVIAMRMHEAALRIGPLTPERLHRIEGVTVYFLFLSATFLVAQRLTEVRHVRSA